VQPQAQQAQAQLPQVQPDDQQPQDDQQSPPTGPSKLVIVGAVLGGVALLTLLRRRSAGRVP